MSWKKEFARNIRIFDLPELGVFKIDDMPEALGRGKFRCTLVLKDGSKAKLTTFDGTIGDIIYTNPKTGWVVAYKEVGKDSAGNSKEYIRFKAAEK